MYCIFSKEAIEKMKGNRGKMAAQAGHAYLHAFWDAEKRLFHHEAESYMYSNKAYKIALIVENESDLYKLQATYKSICGTSLVKDAGLTVFDEPTVTCLGIGPIREDNIGEDLKSLKVFI